VLVISMGPYKFATRPRKAADSYAELVSTRFLSLQGVGRTGKRDQSGTTKDGVLVIEQIPVREPRVDLGAMSLAYNALCCYLPALLKLLALMPFRPAKVVQVTGAPLAGVAYLHKLVHKSFLVLDINERPASVTATGSVFALAAKLEPRILRMGARLADLTLTVAPGHAELLQRNYGFEDVRVVRNCPDAAWRKPYTAPPMSDSLRIVTVGSIFEGRAFEIMIEAIALLLRDGMQVELDIYGPGRPQYLSSLEREIEKFGLHNNVRMHGALERNDVAAAYLNADLGLALYEPGDPGNDSLSNKVMEVVCAGRPVIAGRLPENVRFMEQFEVGWLTDVSAAALAETILEASAALTPNLAEHCYAVGRSELTWSAAFDSVREDALRHACRR